MEESPTAKCSHIPNPEMFGRDSNLEVDGDENVSKFSERHMLCQAFSDGKTEKNNITDYSCIKTECESLNKYPDYCRTITIRGMTTNYETTNVILL